MMKNMEEQLKDFERTAGFGFVSLEEFEKFLRWYYSDVSFEELDLMKIYEKEKIFLSMLQH